EAAAAAIPTTTPHNWMYPVINNTMLQTILAKYFGPVLRVRGTAEAVKHSKQQQMQTLSGSLSSTTAAVSHPSSKRPRNEQYQSHTASTAGTSSALHTAGLSVIGTGLGAATATTAQQHLLPTYHPLMPYQL